MQLALLLLLLGPAMGPCFAQPAPATAEASASAPSPALVPAPAAPPARAAAAASAPARKATSTAAHVQVIEDDNVRIEESRVRGHAQRITVHNKTTRGAAYEIIVPAGGKDSSQERGASGQRAWSVLAF
jgi:hypothetical protein